MPTYYNLDVIQGSTFSARLHAKDSSGLNINLDGHKIRGSVKKRYSSESATLSFDPTIYDAAAGLIDISLTSAQTSLLPVTQSVYDIEMFKTGADGLDDGSYVIKLLDGKVNVHPEVTTSSS
jgi:hypothetical protein